MGQVLLIPTPHCQPAGAVALIDVYRSTFLAARLADLSDWREEVEKTFDMA